MEKDIHVSKQKFIGLIAIAAIAGGCILYTGVQSASWGIATYQQWRSGDRNGWWSSWKSSLTPKTPQQVQPVKIVDEQSQVVDVVKRASPAVVSIVASTEVPTFETYYDSPVPDLPPEFQQFFNFRVPQQRQNGTTKKRIGAGTGFLVSADGYIITNKHVVSDEKAEYTVYLNDEQHRGEKITATVLARDQNNDLAVLKIDKDGLPFISFGDSESLQVGQTAITIGYALGEFDNTVSKGVISGLSRFITAGGGFGVGQSENLRNLIQSDAAINPGNSGGPMLDIEGNVIGVNVAMASAENIGFAIPGNEAKQVYNEVRETGSIQEKKVAFLGVRYVFVDDALQQKNNILYDYGALVARGETVQDLAVVPGSPADKAGIVENDIILQVDDERVSTRNPLADLIASHDPGDTVTLTIYHKGEEKRVPIILGEQ